MKRRVFEHIVRAAADIVRERIEHDFASA